MFQPGNLLVSRGNNGRAAILNANTTQFYTAGNAGNGGNPQPNGITTTTDANGTED